MEANPVPDVRAPASVHTQRLPGEDVTLELRPLMRRMALGMLVLMAVVGVLAVVLQEPLTLGSEWFVDRFGYAGVAVGVLLVDTFMLTHEPFLFAAHAGGLGFWSTFATASGASITAGLFGWFLGGRLGRLAVVQRMFERYRIATFMRRYGFWAIAIAALTPFPFSAATWASGAAGISPRIVLLGSLFRAPKVLFYFLLIVFSWDLGTGW